MYTCSHDAPRPYRSCRHLLDALREVEADPEGSEIPYYRIHFEGSEAVSICNDCNIAAQHELAAACSRCALQLLAVHRHAAFLDFRGTPQPRTRESGLALVTETVDLRSRFRDRVLALAALPSTGRPLWIAWTASRRLVTFELPSGEIVAVSDPIRTELLPEPVAGGQPRFHEQRVTLHPSPDGRLVALLVQATRHGVIADVPSGAVRTLLDRGDYHEDVCAWPFAWSRWRERPIALHGYDWCRLQATFADDFSGARAPDPEDTVSGGSDFLCRLSVSPGGRWIANAGWVWHPVGTVSILPLDAWLDGRESRRVSLNTTDSWDGPNAWLDDGRILVSTLEDLGGHRADGGLVYDVHGEAVGYLHALPYGDLTLDRERARVWCLAPDETSIWDPSTGERLCAAPSAAPAVLHPAAGFAAALVDPEGRFSLSFLERR